MAERDEFPRVTFDEFTPPSYDEWKVEVEKALKGGNFDKKMFTKTYEGITLEPIYTPQRNQEAIAKSVFPGSGNFQRGTKASGYIKEAWQICQRIDDTMVAACNEALHHEIEKGGTAYNIALDEATKENKDFSQYGQIGLGGVSIATLQDMSTLVKGLELETIPLYMECGCSSLAILSLLVAALRAEGKDIKKVTGTVGADPIATWVSNGQMDESLETAFDEMAHTTAWAKEHIPGLRTILVCGDVYHSGGSNDVQELAYTLTTAIAYVREMQQRGLAIDDIVDRMTFTLSLGANFFMEIAKLKALRMIWSQIMEAFGASTDRNHMFIHGRTSAFTKTVYDPYVNMLRNTTQAFSGVVGGLDSMEVSPFDEPIRKGDTFSRRISRNTQIMMKEEFELRQPVDPAGGSWYIETLANELASKIWAELQVIESKGGIVVALREGYPQAEVGKVLASRFKNLEKRSDVAVGNNMYPNMTEVLLDTNPENQEELVKVRTAEVAEYQDDLDQIHLTELLGAVEKGCNEAGELVELVVAACLAGATVANIREALSKSDEGESSIEAIAKHRWTERFEALRTRTEDFKKAHDGENVTVFLANMGPIPQHKPRADFSTGFMEVAAFNVVKNDGFETTDEAAQAAFDAKADVTIICSTDATYPELVPPLAKKLKELMPTKKVFLAGAAPADLEAVYREAGVDDFVHVRANCYEILRSLQREKGMVD